MSANERKIKIKQKHKFESEGISGKFAVVQTSCNFSDITIF